MSNASPSFSCSDFTPSCIRCGLYPRHTFERHDGTRREIRFCAVCALENLKRGLEAVEDEEKKS